MTPIDHPDKAGRGNNLGISLLRRFERLRELSDLDKAITALQAAVDATLDDHPDKAARLSNLGLSLGTRFWHRGVPTDLDKAIAVQQHAVNLTTDDQPDKPTCLTNLGNSLLSRFERLSKPDDLNLAMATLQHAVDLTPDNHPDKARHLNNLGNTFRARFEHQGALTDLDAAITTQQQAVNHAHDDHPNKARYLNNLGKTYLTRATHQPDDEISLARAVLVYSQCARSSSGPPSFRLEAARMWAALCFSRHSTESIDAYSNLISLLPRVVWLGRTVDQRYKDIPDIGDAVAGAAAAAIHFGELNLALEWLEQGRSIVWGQMLQLRTPVENLRQHHPHEAEALEKISRDLESAGMVETPDHSKFSDVGTSQTGEEIAQAHRRLADEYGGVVGRIRNFPNFSEFLLPRKSASLCSAAVSGPVVVVNAHIARCDALILRPHSSHVCHVALPGLQLSAAREMQLQLAGLTRGIDTLQRDYMPYSDDEWPWKDRGLVDILGQLWLHVVKPILHSLKVGCLIYRRVRGLIIAHAVAPKARA